MSADDVVGVCIVNQSGECMSSAGILTKEHSTITQQLIQQAIQLYSCSQTTTNDNNNNTIAPIISVNTSSIQYLISAADNYSTCIAKKSSQS